jgi:hypothetical protein
MSDKVTPTSEKRFHMEQNLDNSGTKLFVDAGKLAATWGLPRFAVVDDIKRGMAGELGTLTGGPYGSTYVVEAWDVSGDRGEAHRQRLTTIKEPFAAAQGSSADTSSVTRP